MPKKKWLKWLLLAPLLILLFLFALITFGFNMDMPRTHEEIVKFLDKDMGSAYARHIPCYGYRVPTWRELDELKKTVSLTRKYPSVIKGIFDPGPGSNMIDLLYFTDELKEIGVNTYFVTGEYDLKNGKVRAFNPNCANIGPVFFPFGRLLSKDEVDRVMIHRILLAKKAGFTVGLLPDYPNVFFLGREKFDTKKLNAQFEAVALKYARWAEEYQVEYLSPINEYNFLLYSNSYTFEEINQLTNAFTANLLPKIRQIYSGKIFEKYGTTEDRTRHYTAQEYQQAYNNMLGLKVTGLDMFSIDCDFGLVDSGPLGTNVSEELQCAAGINIGNVLSQRDGVPWMVGEFLVFTPEDRELVLKNKFWDLKSFYGNLGGPSKVPQEEYYKWALSYYKKNGVNPIGFAFTGYMGAGKIRGSPTVQVVKDFFADWNKK